MKKLLALLLAAALTLGALAGCESGGGGRSVRLDQGGLLVLRRRDRDFAQNGRRLRNFPQNTGPRCVIQRFIMNLLCTA